MYSYNQIKVPALVFVALQLISFLFIATTSLIDSLSELDTEVYLSGQIAILATFYANTVLRQEAEKKKEESKNDAATM